MPRPLSAANISAAALFRVIEAARPTLILDEADTFARDNEELRGVINAGHNGNGMVIRVVEGQRPRAPPVLGLCAGRPGRDRSPAGDDRDRAVIIKLKRRRPDEVVESLRLGSGERARPAGTKGNPLGCRSCGSHPRSDPVVPNAIINRAADNWRPLLAIAEIAGGDWPERAGAPRVTDGESDDGVGESSCWSYRCLRSGTTAGRLEREPSSPRSSDLVQIVLWVEFKGDTPRNRFRNRSSRGC